MKEKTMHDGMMMLCKEIDEIVGKGKLTAGDLETLHKLSDTVKNFLKIEMLEGEEGGYSERDDYSMRRDSRGRYAREGGVDYSRAGDWEARGRFGHSYDEGGSSYANRSQHYVRGHYSREDGRKEMIGELEDMMHKADGSVREAIKRTIEQIEHA